MIQYIYNKDIAYADVDVIVNASNGIGWMGGKEGIRVKKKGLAESLHYASQGEIEKLAIAHCRRNASFGLPRGSLFITDAPSLRAKKIFHAVTMRLPGSKAYKEDIEPLVDKILQEIDNANYEIKSVALSFLGCGTGRLDKEFVREIYERKLKGRKEFFYIYEFKKEENLKT